MESINTLDDLRTELSLKAKNGVDFIVAASLIWLAITYVWVLDLNPRDKSVLTFCVGAVMLPLASFFSKLFNTRWRIVNNPLQPLGLWLNFAQLFYFPFLFLILSKMPTYFVMGYAIITGAHFFPYSWYYRTKLYALSAGAISLGSFLLGIYLTPENMYWIPLSMSIYLMSLSIFLYFNFKAKARESQEQRKPI